MAFTDRGAGVDLAIVVTIDPVDGEFGTHDRDPTLVALARDLTADPGIEGVVVAGSPEDLQGARDAAGGRIRTLCLPGRHRGALRNAGVAATTAPLLLFLADDFAPEPGCVAAHREFHRRSSSDLEVAVGGGFFPERLRVDPFRRWLEDSGALMGASYTRPDSRAAEHFHGANTSMHRSLLARAGPFREDFEGPVFDDDEMGRRLRALGARIRYVSEARASHEHAVTVAERRRAVRSLGHANAKHAMGGPATTPRPGDLMRPIWELSLRAHVARMRAAISPTAERREKFWRRVLSYEFVRGYREASSPWKRGHPASSGAEVNVFGVR